MTTIHISGITQNEFANRVHKALESVTQSPIVKRKNAVVNKAMVEILHGGNNAGQNEHNLSKFFEEKEEMTSYWIGSENYRHESDTDDLSEVYEGESKEEVEHKMYSSVVSYLSDWLEASIDVSDFHEQLEVFEENPLTLYEQENEIDIYNLEGEEISEMIKSIISDCSHIVLVAVFEYMVNLMNVEGSHSFKEITIPQSPKK